MKKSKKSYLIIALIVLLLALAVGYAAFSTNLFVNGTATGTGTWDVKFVSASMSDSKHGTATVTNDTTVSVAAELAYPGDGCTVTANIKNEGNIDAKLTAFTLKDSEGNEYSNEDVEVTIPTISTDGSEVIKAGETCPVTFAIKWKDASETKTGVSSNFKISFTYEQNTTTTNPQPSHGTHVGE